MRRLAISLSFGIGFLSLSQEILWVRIVSLVQEGRPHAFAMVLIVFLFGISVGSMVGGRICRRAESILKTAGWALLVAASIDVIALLLCSTRLVAPAQGSPRLQAFLLMALLALVGLCAFAKGVLFPIVHHLGTDAHEGRVGRSVSHVYLANVLGSTLGPLITGFWLLDIVGVEAALALVALGTTLLGGLTLWFADALQQWPARSVFIGMSALCIGLGVRPPEVVARIAGAGMPKIEIRHIVQNKHGVIHVLAEEKAGTGDITYGGNAFDGRINVDPVVNSNWLDRAYVMAALHPRPRRVLIVGMSTGAWTAVILGMPGVEHVDIVEINPGYLDLVKVYGEVAPLLKDRRVHIHIDDGRRWLRSNADQRYDLIFQNTTHHWRAYATLQLSKEYLQQLDRHLAEGGIAAVNTTDSLDVFATAMQVFPSVARYRNFVYTSRSPLTKRGDAEDVLRRCRIWDKAAFTDASFAPGQIGAVIAREPLEPAADYLARSLNGRNAMVVTDLNMATEFRHGAAPPFDWMRRLQPSDAGSWLR